MPFHNSNRVFHFFMRIFREGGDHFYPFAGNCVRTVNYAQRRFIAFDQRQRATNIFRRSQFRRERIPCAQFLQCFFCINASGNMFRIANRQTTAIQQRSPVGFAVDGEIFLLAGFRCYNDQAIAEQCLTRSSIDRFFINRIIHPFLIGRNKQIRRGTRFNLTGESR